MNTTNLNHLKKWFSNYVAAYYSDNPDHNRAIRLKEDHTRRVCANIIRLCTDLRISDENIRVAEAMALLHDVGRFEQYTVYRTFNDRASENHARLGIRQIAKHNVLKGCSEKSRRYITRSIAYHNAAKLPEDEEEITLFFMRLLRDADKLDIWNVFINYYRERENYRNTAIELDLPDDPDYSPKILEAFYTQSFALIQDLKTLNDFKLLQISWVFDLNFIPSFQMIHQRKYINQIEATLPQSEEITEAVKQAYTYIENHLLNSGTDTVRLRC
jgi:hypothetical protein